MSAYFHSYQSTASSILNSFSFKESFPVYLKKFFKQHKKYGSRDRKIIADLCFGFFRMIPSVGITAGDSGKMLWRTSSRPPW